MAVECTAYCMNMNMPKICMHVANTHVHCIHVHTICPYICIECSISHIPIGASWPTISSFYQHKLHAAHVHCQNIPYASHLLHGSLDIVLCLQHNIPQALLKIPICHNASNAASQLYTNASCKLSAMAKKMHMLKENAPQLMYCFKNCA